MKIKYKFVNGEISEIEVDDYFGEILKGFNRKQRNSSRVYRRHNYSLEATMFQGKDYGYEEEFDNILKEVPTLTETEYRRLFKHVCGYTMKEIAQQEGVVPSVVYETINSARKKIKKYL